MSCVTGIQPRLEDAMACYLDYVTCYTCTPSVCMCVTVSMRLCVCACVCWRGPVYVCMCQHLHVWNHHQDIRTPGVCVHAQRQMWLYMIKCLLKRDRASVGIKSGGWREETEWETVWQKQANSVKRKRAQERLTDRRVRIIDRGSDRESMWWWDNRQTDSQGREAEGEEQGRQGETVLFCSKLQNGASEALCLALQRCFITKLDRRNSQTDFNLQSNHLFTIAIHCYWLLIYWLEAKAVKEWCWVSVLISFHSFCHLWACRPLSSAFSGSEQHEHPHSVVYAGHNNGPCSIHLFHTQSIVFFKSFKLLLLLLHNVSSWIVQCYKPEHLQQPKLFWNSCPQIKYI